MDNIDRNLITALRRNSRASVSALALELKVSRATLRARLDRLLANGEILGFTVVLRGDALRSPVRGQMMIAIEGRGTERVIRQLASFPSIEALHTTNGKWDLIAEIGAGSLEEFDGILRQIRLLDGVARSETNLLLATRKLARAGAPVQTF
ncbi:MAG: Lrp/AsnC family transcriptional regulator [Paracoccaceae bacterium]